MNVVSQTAIDYWNRVKTKKSPSGWISRNAPCCQYRGNNPDKRGRGGMKIDGETVSIHCFNCGFTASFSPGKPLYPKFRKILEWTGVSETLLNSLKLESLKLSIEDTISKPIIVPKLKTVGLPESFLLEDNTDKYPKHIEFLKTRGFTPSDFPFLVSNNLVYKNRVILPFIMHDTIIGYSARSIKINENVKYIMKMTTPFVFGLDFIKPNHQWAILSEGLFDALSVRGLAVMHNEISEEQINMVNDLQKTIIVVPHLDKAGLENNDNSLIKIAIDNDWNVSIPEWDCKDINQAYTRYGELFVVKHIIDTATNNHTTIKLKQKMYLNKIGKK